MKNQTFTVYYDEAWRWPLAGPVYIGLICSLSKLTEKTLEPFCDSKKISEERRNQHFDLIKSLENDRKIIAKSARMSAAEIDKYWMTISLHCAILRGLIQVFWELFPNDFLNLRKTTLTNPLSSKIGKKNLIKYSDVLSAFADLNSKWIKIRLIMDWNSDFWLKKSFPFWDIQTVVHWDATIKEISMASIIAKVSRDNVMENLPKKYDKYNFSKHKWYWTKEHTNLINKFWVSDIHRKLFLKHVFPNHKIEKLTPDKF